MRDALDSKLERMLQPVNVQPILAGLSEITQWVHE